MRLAIVGSRHFIDYQLFKAELLKYLAEMGEQPIEIISGGAKGADTLAEKWAKQHKIEMTVFPADWKTHGKSAGPRRNIQIVTKATHILAFAAKTSVGTFHSIWVAKKQGKPCKVVEIK